MQSTKKKTHYYYVFFYVYLLTLHTNIVTFSHLETYLDWSLKNHECYKTSPERWMYFFRICTIISFSNWVQKCLPKKWKHFMKNNRILVNNTVKNISLLQEYASVFFNIDVEDYYRQLSSIFWQHFTQLAKLRVLSKDNVNFNIFFSIKKKFIIPA